jgi:hypothetical protein
MAIYGIGAFYDEDVSDKFVRANIVGAGWSAHDAPELHQFIRSLKVGDIVYIKAFPPGSREIIVKAIGVIADDVIVDDENSNGVVSCGRNVRWVSTQQFALPQPREKNNVRANTLYEEFHPVVQREILARLAR